MVIFPAHLHVKIILKASKTMISGIPNWLFFRQLFKRLDFHALCLDPHATCLDLAHDFHNNCLCQSHQDFQVRLFAIQQMQESMFG